MPNVQPKVIHYLEAFETALSEMGVPVPPRITKSDGGVMGVDQVKAECVQMILSGTASGVIGAGYIAESCGFPKLLSPDIGGTSADVVVIENGRAEYGTGEIIGGFQIFIPSVSVTSVGQGGGSIAWIDDFGVLRVGPDSAGSLPGPVCYQRGGTLPTLTDAFVVCGMIGHGDLGHNAVKVDGDPGRVSEHRRSGRLIGRRPMPVLRLRSCTSSKRCPVGPDLDEGMTSTAAAEILRREVRHSRPGGKTKIAKVISRQMSGRPRR